MVSVVGQMFLIPVRTFIYGMAMLVDALRGMQRAGDRGMEAFAGGETVRAAPATQTPPAAPTDSDHPAAIEAAGSLNEETEQMNQTLNNDRVKLVRYKILSLKRDEEKVVVDGKDELVTDNIEDSAYVAWKIAEHCDTAGKSAEKDGKYLRVYFEVLESWERQKDDDQIKVLKQIRDNIGGVRDNIGGSATKM
jgi:hypothetical protein